MSALIISVTFGMVRWSPWRLNRLDQELEVFKSGRSFALTQTAEKYPKESITIFYLESVSMNSVGGFQSSALPTELPGHRYGSAYLNGSARESQVRRGGLDRFSVSTAIIPRTGRFGFGDCDVNLTKSDRCKINVRHSSWLQVILGNRFPCLSLSWRD